MYAHQDIWLEDVCYEQDHVNEVVEEIRKNFDEYFQDFIETEGGIGVSDEDFEKLKKKMGATSTGNKKKSSTMTASFKRVIVESLESFEKDQEKYIEIFDAENLEEDEEDVNSFKSKTLKNECPIIHSTLFNKRAKELDKYRGQFSIADPNELYEVIKTLSEFGTEYEEEIYDPNTYEEIESYEELGMEPMDTDEFTVYGVIGGGIKSHMMYKVHPSVFPNRSRSAIWALWYLTDKKKFGCHMDSEFLMIDVDKSIVQQNYFYPYEIFSFYAFEIYLMLRDKATELDAYIDPDYRYVIVDEFLDFVADQHADEIDFMKSQIKDGGWGYV